MMIETALQSFCVISDECVYLV